MEDFKAKLLIDFPIERDMSIRGILEKSLRIYLLNLKPILKIALWIYIPLETISQLLFYLAGYTVDDPEVLWFDIPAGLVADSLIFPSIIFALFAVFRGEAVPSTRESFRYGLLQWWRIIKADFIVVGAVFFGIFLFVVPGILFMVWYSLVAVIISIEGDDQPFPFARSKALVKGHFFKVFVLLLLSFAFLVPFAFLGGFFSVYFQAIIGAPLAELFTEIAVAAAMPFLMIVTLVIYLQLSAAQKNPAQEAEKEDSSAGSVALMREL